LIVRWCDLAVTVPSSCCSAPTRQLGLTRIAEPAFARPFESVMARQAGQKTGQVEQRSDRIEHQIEVREVTAIQARSPERSHHL